MLDHPFLEFLDSYTSFEHDRYQCMMDHSVQGDYRGRVFRGPWSGEPLQ